MVVYNLSMKVEEEISQKWIEWQHKEHIPQIMSTGLFKQFQFLRLLEHDTEEDLTYIIQYYTDSIESYNRYISEFAPLLKEKAIAKWNDRVVIFRSIMETVQ